VPWAVVRDITLTNNTFDNVGSGVNLSANETYGGVTTPRGTGFDFRNNVFTNVGSTNALGICFQFLLGPDDVQVTHNTCFYSSGFNGRFGEVAPYSQQGANFLYRDNMVAFGGYGFRCDTGYGTHCLDAGFSSWTFTHNVIIADPYGSSGLYPTGQFWPANTTAVGFVDYAGGNFRLTSGSAYHNAATDGTDIGADIDALEAAMAGEEEASAPVLSVPIPESGTKLAKTATSTTIGITTDVAATCRWGGRPSLAWGDLTAFSTTGGTTHSSTLPVVAGGVYQMCARCLTTLYSADSCTSFSVDAQSKSWWWR
jgi:hypothetical protein